MDSLQCMYPGTLQSILIIFFLSRNACSQVPNLTCWSNYLTSSILLSTSIKTPQAFSPKPEKLNIASSVIAKVHKAAFSHYYYLIIVFSHQKIYSSNLSDDDHVWGARKTWKWFFLQQLSLTEHMSFISSHHRYCS